MGRSARINATFLVCHVLICWAIAGCFPEPQVRSAEAAVSRDPVQRFQEWQLIKVKSGQRAVFEVVMDDLVDRDVIYIGEEHRNRYHIEAALKILAELLARGRRPALTVEMFSWDGQRGLDRYVSGEETNRESFLAESRWSENWGGEYRDYEPLVLFARQHDLHVRAMNPPRPLVQQVARRGWIQTQADPEMKRWGMQDELIPEDPLYRELIVKQIRDCHGGMSEAAYERFLEASAFRDEGMAKTIAVLLKGQGNGMGPVVSYTGGGHIQRGVPVPDRVVRRSGGSISQVTVYLASFESDHPEYTQALLDEDIADYVWLTPVSEHGPPRRCG